MTLGKPLGKLQSQNDTLLNKFVQLYWIYNIVLASGFIASDFFQYRLLQDIEYISVCIQ